MLEGLFIACALVSALAADSASTEPFVEQLADPGTLRVSALPQSVLDDEEV